jgi:hypothetical protein
MYTKAKALAVSLLLDNYLEGRVDSQDGLLGYLQCVEAEVKEVIAHNKPAVVQRAAQQDQIASVVSNQIVYEGKIECIRCVCSDYMTYRACVAWGRCHAGTTR